MAGQEPANDYGTPVTQAPLLSAVSYGASPVVTQAPLLVAVRPPATVQVRTTQAPVLAAVNYDGNIDVRVTQAALLIAYKTGVPGQTRQRAWTFDFDGHSFYVLDLSEEGTWVLDLTTGEWSKFETPGYGVWNMLNGFAWESNRMVVGGDSIVPTVYKLDPSSHLDDGWRAVEYKVSGAILSRSRNGVRHNSLRLAVSAGYTVDSEPIMTLRWSDNNGGTWSNDYDFPIYAGQYSQRIEWNSLGLISNPGRVFELSDTGGLIRIDGLEADIEGME